MVLEIKDQSDRQAVCFWKISAKYTKADGNSWVNLSGSQCKSTRWNTNEAFEETIRATTCVLCGPAVGGGECCDECRLWILFQLGFWNSVRHNRWVNMNKYIPREYPWLVSFQSLDEWNFDVFELGEAGDGHALKYLGLEVLHRYDLLNKFKVVNCYRITRSLKTNFMFETCYPSLEVCLSNTRICETDNFSKWTGSHCNKRIHSSQLLASTCAPKLDPHRSVNTTRRRIA